MNQKTIQIYASGDYYHVVDEALPELKEIIHQVTGKSFRRIGRFIQLAMIGAAHCTQLSVPSDTAVYLASGRGDLELTIDIMRDLFICGQTPKPLRFVNTVNNAACFYVAQLLKLESRSNYICNRYFAFESAMQIAATDLLMNNIPSALIGSVDLCTAPLTEHKQRLYLASETKIAEASHWLWLGKSDQSKPRVGELLDVQHFADRDILIAWANAHSHNQLALSRGQFVNDVDWNFFATHIEHNQIFDYRINRGHYDSQSGAVIGEFLRSDSPATTLIHFNADTEGRYSIMVVRR